MSRRKALFLGSSLGALYAPHHLRYGNQLSGVRTGERANSARRTTRCHRLESVTRGVLAQVNEDMLESKV